MKPHDIGILAGIMRTESIGTKTILRLLPQLGSLEALLTSPPGKLFSLGAVPHLIDVFLQRRKDVDPEAELKLLEQHQIQTLTWEDPRYPVLLKEIDDFPLLLFIRGDIAALSGTFPMAVVGTRKHTAYGARCTAMITEELTKAGATIISGLAAGIDEVAHYTCLNNNGVTVAVVGTGIDDESIYPRTNVELSHRIIKNGGALITEYPVNTPGKPHRFPRRNRIVAGLSKGTIVVEAPEASGALITARCALDFGRDVFVVPGPITSPESTGSNRLLSDGAIPVLSSTSVLEHYDLVIARTTAKAGGRGNLADYSPNSLSTQNSQLDCFTTPAASFATTKKLQTPDFRLQTTAGLTKEEQQLYALAVLERRHPDEIAATLQLPIHEILSKISLLELRGFGLSR